MDPAPLPPDEVVLTPRCKLRRPVEGDIERTWTATRVPGFNDGMRWPPPTHRDELVLQHERNLAAWAEGRWYAFAIEELAGGRCIGRVSLSRETEPGVWSLGFWIHPDAQGRGYASETARALVAFGFDRLGARAIRASHVEWNAASGTVLRRAGLRRIGRDEHGHEAHGHAQPLELYELTRAESGRDADPSPR